MVARENKEDIQQTLITEIATILSMDEEDIDADTPLDSLGMDSIRFVETIIMIEREFGVQLMERGVTPEDIQDVQSLARCIESAESEG
jgi:acyl carrier protein